MEIFEALGNPVFLSAVLAWALAQVLKVPIEYVRKRNWNFALLLSSGGMPSSHSALATGAAWAAGLVAGFGSPVFAVATVVAIVVVYDATGVRRQVGRHAVLINTLMRDVVEGHPLRHEKLAREMLGHSPLEALGGVFVGLIVAQLYVNQVA